MQTTVTFICPIDAEQLVAGTFSDVCHVTLSDASGVIAEADTVDKRYDFTDLKPGAYEVKGQRLDTSGQPIGEVATEAITLGDADSSITVEMA